MWTTGSQSGTDVRTVVRAKETGDVFETKRDVPCILEMQGTIGLVFPLCLLKVSVGAFGPVLLPHLHSALCAIIPLGVVLAGVGL